MRAGWKGYLCQCCIGGLNRAATGGLETLDELEDLAADRQEAEAEMRRQRASSDRSNSSRAASEAGEA